RGVLRTGLGMSLLVAMWAAAPASATGLMVTGGFTSQPIGHYEFCRVNVAECSIRTRDRGPAAVTDTLSQTIVAVNAEVNRAIKRVTGGDIYGRGEAWIDPDSGAGDCEDYVLETRRRPARSGLSLSDLRIPVVRKRNGEGHAVLTVRTDRGDFILDNLTDK